MQVDQDAIRDDVLDVPSRGLLSDAQKSRLRVSCQYMDKLLQDVETILHSAESRSPFPRYLVDLSPGQMRVLEDYIRRFRAQLLRTLAWQSVEASRPEIPVTRAISTHLHFIDIALADMRPSVMLGSGALSEQSASELSGVVHELSSLTQNMMSYIRQQSGKSLSERIQKLGDSQTSDSDVQATLQRLAEVIDGRGMVEFRPRLALLLANLEDRNFEVALFGRVSAGKSSFINALLEQDVLPVGVNPVTAVPTRIRYGNSVSASVTYGSGSPTQVSIEQFCELISETANANNLHNVTRALLDVPSPRLSEGIVLVDTPGLGSLARRGTAETLAYLPSSDLALVFIDAGNTMNAEDIGTLRMITEAGIAVLVLLSKCDLLSPSDLPLMKSYIEEQVHRELGTSITVHPISSISSDYDYLSSFFTQELEPRFAQADSLRRQSFVKKVESLRSDLSASLSTTIDRASHYSSHSAPRFTMMEQRLRTITGMLGDLHSSTEERTATLHSAAPVMIDELANEINQNHTRSFSSRELEEKMNEMVHRRVEELITYIRHVLKTAIEHTRDVGRELGQIELPETAMLEGVMRDLPRFKLTLPQPIQVSAGSWMHLSSFLLKTRAVSKLDSQVKPILQEQLLAYTIELSLWARRVLHQVQFRLNAFLDSYRAIVQASLLPVQPEDLVLSSGDALELLQNPNCHKAAAINGVLGKDS